MIRLLIATLFALTVALPLALRAHADIGPCNGCPHSAQISASRVG